MDRDHSLAVSGEPADDGLNSLDALRGELARVRNVIKAHRSAMFFAKSRTLQHRKSEQIRTCQIYEAQLQRRIARRERAERLTHPGL